MRPAHASPVDAELGSIRPWCLALGNEGNALSEVECCILTGIDSLDLNQGSMIVLVAKSALITEDTSVDIEPAGLGFLRHDRKCVLFFLVCIQIRGRVRTGEMSEELRDDGRAGKQPRARDVRR
mmetsp:Transcript_13938/g.40781  ORF Transcript_13938/g.40781 Transcript_13938/m.40781 type:complete len:124 (+) Transcript_13938:226-597(+)